MSFQSSVVQRVTSVRSILVFPVNGQPIGMATVAVELFADQQALDAAAAVTPKEQRTIRAAVQRISSAMEAKKPIDEPLPDDPTQPMSVRQVRLAVSAEDFAKVGDLKWIEEQLQKPKALPPTKAAQPKE